MVDFLNSWQVLTAYWSGSKQWKSSEDSSNIFLIRLDRTFHMCVAKIYKLILKEYYYIKTDAAINRPITQSIIKMY